MSAPARPTAGGRHGRLVGLLAVVILGYILVNTLRTQGPGAGGLSPGQRLPPFAAPLALSSLDGDANVAVRPGSGAAGRVPACSVRSPDVVNSCELSRGAPLALGFLFTRGASCAGSFDALQAVQASVPGVRVAGVVVRGDRDAARRLIRSRGWSFPVAYDRDGQVANVYGVAGCPEVVLAYPGGTVRETVIGRDRAERDLRRHVEALAAAARRRGWRPPA